MQEVESKRKLTPADGAHIFYAGIFLSGSFIIKTQHPHDCSVDLDFFNDLLFYGLLLWTTFLIITLVPRYKNDGLRLFFNLLDLIYGLFHLILVCYGATQYYSENNDCGKLAPALNFFTHLYIWVTGFTGGIVLIGFLVWFFKKFVRPNELAGFQKSTDI